MWELVQGVLLCLLFTKFLVEAPQSLRMLPFGGVSRRVGGRVFTVFVGVIEEDVTGFFSPSEVGYTELGDDADERE